MFLKPRKSSTDPRLRSLLQKAVRRGAVAIVERVASRLDAIGDATWLRSRSVVITFEESWPLATSLAIDRYLPSKTESLKRVTISAKQKDAAGLGALAHAYREGDTSMLSDVPDQRALKIVAEALARPQDFFRWVARQSGSQRSRDVIRVAEKYLSVATWQWDKACILAGALLATGVEVPVLHAAAVSGPEDDFPYWAALDKHTDEGKAAFKELAKALGTTYRHLIWVSFYCESAQVNELVPSPWFDAERAWRFKRTGLSWESASELWARARPVVQRRLEYDARALKQLLLSPNPRSCTSSQDSLI